MLDRIENIYRPASGVLLLLCAAVVGTGCGGGGANSEQVATRTAFSSGAITGLGSIIVNGVRFDDSTASVSDDDDGDSLEDDKDYLRLGMVVEIESESLTNAGMNGKATKIRFGPEIVGLVSSVAADGSSLVLLGQTVAITATTVVDDSLVGGIAGLVPGTSVIEVHAFFDAATGAYTATRIEPELNAPYYKLRGMVTNIDKTAMTLSIGSSGETISYRAIATAVPASLDNGMLVKVKLQTMQVDGQWIATQIENGARRVDDDHDEAEIEGRITATTFDVDKKFSVNGLAVDASQAAFPDGTAGIVLGARVEVEGRAVGGVIIATRVELEDEHEVEVEGFELHGEVLSFDDVTKTFMLRGIKVSFDNPALVVDDGLLSDLRNTRQVEVKGELSDDGTMLVATYISFES